METIQVTLPDGTHQDVAKGTTPRDIAESISPRLASAALVAKANGELVDLTEPLNQDTELRILTTRDAEALQVYRHSSAHLLATAVVELYPETKLGIGPATEQGFYYDFEREEPFTPRDLEKIEAKMAEIVKSDPPNQRVWRPREETLAEYRKIGDWMKCELIEDKTDSDRISIYKTGEVFNDFCRGPHIPSMGRIKAFKLLSVAGAYWKGDEKNARLQRIYGTSFFDRKELRQYLDRLEEAKKRDHRKLGKELDLYSIQESAGPGLIFWHPKGGTIRRAMEDWLRDEYVRRGYGLVYTPHVARFELWKTSGHADFYSEDMFKRMELDDAEYQLKPMNCPFHILIYKDKLRSYRDLPVRLGELGTVYRYERSGVMHGLMRVRGFTQDDAHIFCTPEQVKDEILGCIDFGLDVLKTFGFDEYVIELSTWDGGASGQYAGSPEEWKMAEDGLFSALTERGIEAKVMPNEAAFYGPKIDIKLVDAIGRPWQLSTVQFDFNLPRRFELEYIAEDGKAHQPVMVHRALWGSVERFFGVLIEHYAGAFPVWLAPVQTIVLPITDRQNEYAQQVVERLKQAGIRVELDERSEKVNFKIREAQLQKIPFMLVLGGREAEAGAVSVRHRKDGDQGVKPLDEFVTQIRGLIDSKDCKA
ncbi:MAG: threonine--tRNA ligase [Acidobacteria bacterium]|nr:threonine--tRNA ligase [Acidobacteriota bacterium]